MVPTYTKTGENCFTQQHMVCLICLGCARFAELGTNSCVPYFSRSIKMEALNSAKQPKSTESSTTLFHVHQVNIKTRIISCPMLCLDYCE